MLTQTTSSWIPVLKNQTALAGHTSMAVKEHTESYTLFFLLDCHHFWPLGLSPYPRMYGVERGLFLSQCC